MPPSDPAACPNCTSPQRGVRYSDDPGALCGHSWHDKPSDPAAVPPPEWALDAAHEYFSEQWTHLGIPNGIAVNVSPLARLLASVREGALREAAALRVEFPGVVHGIANPCDACQIAYTTGSLDAADAIHKAILSLLHTPPSGGGA